MNARSVLQAAAVLVISTCLAQEKPATTKITLRALLDMIDEPAAAATNFALAQAKLSEEEKAAMRLTIPSSVFESWMEAAKFLAAPVKDGEEPIEVFPPGLRNAIKAEPELQLKREHLQLSLDRLRQLCEARANAGEASD